MYNYKDPFYCDIELTIEQQFELQSLSIALQTASREQLIEFVLLNTKSLLLANNRGKKMMADIIKNKL